MSEPVKTIYAANNEVVCRGEPLSEPVYWVGRQWAVTAYGLECRDGTYAVEASRLWEGRGQWEWEDQLGQKNWVDKADMVRALHHARKQFANLEPPL